jgi:hypothetical protein
LCRLHVSVAIGFFPDARLNRRVEPPQATCFSAWSLTFSLHANTEALRSGHVLQRVVVDCQPTLRLKVRNHALKHVACAAVASREGRPRARDHALKEPVHNRGEEWRRGCRGMKNQGGL